VRIRPMLRSLLLGLVFLFAWSSIAIAKPVPNSNEKAQVPLTKTELQSTEIVGFDDQGQQQKFQVRDSEVDPLDPEQKTYLYTVFYQDRQQNWQNLCQPDAKGVAKAVVLQGSWDSRGNYHPNKKLVTFSCTNGALAKCMRFGYKPWKNIKGRSLQDYHSACVRMVRADYCGDGVAHTKDGTPINLYDRLGIQKPDVEPEMRFEAAWGVNGAQCINHVRWPEALAYVKRVCPQRLITRGNHCITAEKAQRNFPGALLFNDSVVRSGRETRQLQ
jgi:hypothetical protein